MGISHRPKKRAPTPPQVAADQVEELDGRGRVADRVERDLDRGREERRADQDRDGVDEAEGGDAARGKRVGGPEQAVEPDGGERLGEHDEQLQRDPGARQRLVVDQVGQRRSGIVGHEEPRPDDHEPEHAGNGQAEIEQPGGSREVRCRTWFVMAMP